MAIASNEKNITVSTAQLLKELESKNILETIADGNNFYDEPKTFYYQAIIKLYSDYLTKQKYSTIKKTASVGGLSLTSPSLALLKCVSEAIERLSLFCYLEESILSKTYKQLENKAVDLSHYTKEDIFSTRPLGWVEGHNLTQKQDTYIPAQLIYLSYIPKKEFHLGPRLSTGAACGLTHETTLLRGIYEAIERDTVMTMYLNKIPVPRIANTTIKDKQLQEIIEQLTRYNLELFLYDITNDLQIPTFLSLVIDKTGLGPTISAGPKTGFNLLSTIKGSIEEDIMGRPFVRQQILKSKNNQFTIKKNEIDTKEDRLLYWASPDKLPFLEFLLMQPTIAFHNKPFDLSPKEELKQVIQKLSDKGFEVFFKDITIDFAKHFGLRVYKVLIPGLQPLYLAEKDKKYVTNRLRTVAQHFGKVYYAPYQIPHPFL